MVSQKMVGLLTWWSSTLRISVPLERENLEVLKTQNPETDSMICGLYSFGESNHRAHLDLRRVTQTPAVDERTVKEFAAN
jgi:hypothetical protein